MVEMVQGSTRNFTVTVIDRVTGAVQDISTWTAFRAVFKNNVADTDAQAVFVKTLGSGITVTNGPGGVITVKIVRANTTGLAVVPYSLPFEVTGVDGAGDPWSLVEDVLRIVPYIARTSP